MYREWTRDFRRCSHDCESAVLHLKNGTLFKWYETKTQSIKSYARSMLAGVCDREGMYQLFDKETRIMIPMDLVTMERRKKSIDNDYNIALMTPRIAEIVADVQLERDWHCDWEVLNMFFRNLETRPAARRQFQNRFVEKFRKDLSKMPPCFEMGKTSGIHPLSPLNGSAEVAMPWKGLDQQPALGYISIGKDADGNLYSEMELRAVMDAVVDRDSPPIYFLIPCAQDWVNWGAAVVLSVEEEGKRAVHVIFFETTMKSDQDIYAKGLNQLRDAVPANWKLGDGLDIHYHYVLVLPGDDEAALYMPKWRHVLLSSKGQRTDPSWSPDNLRQYVMFVRTKELRKPQWQD
jgi:hypothetical protein